LQLDRIIAEIRPRSAHEGGDLGLTLARRFYGAMCWRWCLTALPAVVLLAALLTRHPMWALVIFWWLKPAFEQAPLFFVSRALFDAPPDRRQTFQALPGLLRHSLRWLLWQRLNPARGLLMPARMLEGVRGRQARQRSRHLREHTGGTAAAMTFWFHVFELLLWLGLLSTALMLMPESWVALELEEWFDQLIDGQPHAAHIGWWVTGFYMLASALLTPFYVGASFGLYLNTRTHLEGWDIELAFRRLGLRLEKAATKGAAVIVTLLLLGAAEAAHGQTAPPPKQVIQEVLEHPDFQTRRVRVSRWEWDSQPNLGSPNVWAPSRTAMLIVLGIVGGISLVALLYALHRHHRRRRPAVGGKPAAPLKQEPVGCSILDRLDSKSLPDHPPAAAQALFDAGRPIEALSLLYRGAIVSLVRNHDVIIRESDTESDCLKRLDARTGDLRPYMARLIETWIAGRYGNRVPNDRRFLQLCHDWPFSTPSTPA